MARKKLNKFWTPVGKDFFGTNDIAGQQLRLSKISSMWSLENIFNINEVDLMYRRYPSCAVYTSVVPT